MPSILVLEQDPRSLERLHHTLGTAGWRVRIVHDPAEAFTAAAAERPDLVIVGASVSGSASVAGSFARRSGGPGVLALLPPGTTAAGFDGLPADELLPAPFTDQDLLAAVQRAGTAPRQKPAAPSPAAAPRPESKLTSLDIFGDVLAELDDEEPAPVPAAAGPVSAPVPQPPQTAQTTQPAVPRPAPRPVDDDLNAELEKTLTGVFGADLMKTRPAAPAQPPQPPPQPVTVTPTPRPVPPPRKPDGGGGGDDDIDAILSRTLGNLDPNSRRPAAAPPRPTPPVTTPSSEGTAVRRPATALDQFEELSRSMRSPAPAPQASRPVTPAPVAPIAQTPPPAQPPASVPQTAPIPLFEPEPFEPEPFVPEPVFVPEPEPPAPAAQPLAVDPPSSSSPFGSDPFDLSALEIPPPVELPATETVEEPFFELELEPEIEVEPELESAPEPVSEPVPAADVATTQRIPVMLDDTLDIPGAERFGQYTLLEKIAAGGMAEVWKARMRGVEGFQKTVAIKKILPHMTDNSEFIGMFIDEAKLAAQLSHPNIVHIYDLGKIGRDYYIAMEYVEGKDLRSILNASRRKGRPLPLALALLIASRLASALDYAHRKRDFEGEQLALVHRDVSPQNVLITSEGDVKLCDFGIAKAVSKAGQTQMGALKGKLQYMSPEQAWGRAVDSRSDIFSLGAVLFEMITGERLFSGDTEMSVLEAVRQGKIRRPREIDPAVPPAVDEIVARALAYEVGDRFQSAGEMMQRIEAVLHETPPTPGPGDLSAYLERVLTPDDPSSDVMFMPPRPQIAQSVQPVPLAAPPRPAIPAPSAHPQAAPAPPAPMPPVEVPESLFAPHPTPSTEAVPVEAVSPVGDVHVETGGSKSRLLLVIAIVLLLLGVLATFFLLNRRGAGAPPPAESPAASPGATSQPPAPGPTPDPAPPAATHPGVPGAVPAAGPAEVSQPSQPVDYEAVMQEEIKKGLQEKEAELRRKYEKKLREDMAKAEKAAQASAAPSTDPVEPPAETEPPPH
jgi:serine/threonine protein kinase